MLFLNVEAVGGDGGRHEVQGDPGLGGIIGIAHIVEKSQIHIRREACLKLKAVLARNASPARYASFFFISTLLRQ